MTDTSLQFPGILRRLWEREVVQVMLAMAVLAGWVALATWDAPRPLAAKNPNGYYNLLTEAFVSGQLSLKGAPAPGLLRLPNPYDPVANARFRIHDASLFRGRYYLYYGVAPAVMVFLPWRILTGTYLSEYWAVVGLCLTGAAASLSLFQYIRRSYFLPESNVGIGLVRSAIVVGTMAPSIIPSAYFYQVPIAAAYAFLMVGLRCLVTVLDGHSGPVGVRLAVASFFIGLAVASRANYVLLALVVFWPPVAWLTWWRPGAQGFYSRETLRILVMAFGPLASIGAGLALYNFLRFDSPWEFGMKYALAGSYTLDKPIFDVGLIRQNLGFYLFEPLRLGRYFPFLAESRALGAGMLWMTPIVVGVVGVPLAVIRTGGAARSRGIAVVVLAIALGALANLLMLCLFIGRADRYLVDLLPIWVLLGAIGWLLVLQASQARLPLKRILLLACVATSGVTVVANLAFGFARLPDPERVLDMARLFNRPVAWLERLGNAQYGAYELSVKFQERPIGAIEPLLVSGTAADRYDAIYAHYVAPRRVTIGFVHAGAGTIESAPVSVVPGAQVTIRAFFGAILPPKAHPVFSNWTEREFLVARNSVWVEMDGRRILTGASQAYLAAPGDHWVGEMPFTAWAFPRTFSGEVRQLGRSPLARNDFSEPEVLPVGPIRMSLRLPMGGLGNIEPLIETGTAGSGNQLWIRRTGVGRVRFGVYLSGFGGPETDEVEANPADPHDLVVWMGSLLAPGASAPGVGWDFDPKKRVILIFDGRVLLDLPLQLPEATINDRPRFGRSVLGLGIGESMFSGRIENIMPVDWRSLPEFAVSGGYGAIKMKLRWPDNPGTVSEPLVTTGTNGAGDFLFVRFLGGLVQFGFDHWAVGEILGSPVTIDPRVPVELEITMGSLYSPSQHAEMGQKWLRRIEVRMNKTVVLSGVSACHPSSARQIQIGKNLIGGSSCGPRFTGEIVKISRTPRPEFEP